MQNLQTGKGGETWSSGLGLGLRGSGPCLERHWIWTNSFYLSASVSCSAKKKRCVRAHGWVVRSRRDWQEKHCPEQLACCSALEKCCLLFIAQLLIPVEPGRRTFLAVGPAFQRLPNFSG